MKFTGRNTYIQNPVEKTKQTTQRQPQTEPAAAEPATAEPATAKLATSDPATAAKTPPGIDTQQGKIRQEEIINKQVTILKRGITIANSFAILDPDHVEEISESDPEIIEDQISHVQKEKEEQEVRSPTVIPKSLGYLNLENTAVEKTSDIKECSQKVYNSEDGMTNEEGVSRGNRDDADKQLVLFSTENNNEDINTEDINGEDMENAEFQKITRRNKKGKDPVVVVQRNLRSSAKPTKESGKKLRKSQDKNKVSSDDDDVLEHKGC